MPVQSWNLPAAAHVWAVLSAYLVPGKWALQRLTATSKAEKEAPNLLYISPPLQPQEHQPLQEKSLTPGRFEQLLLFEYFSACLHQQVLECRMLTYQF